MKHVVTREHERSSERSSMNNNIDKAGSLQRVAQYIVLERSERLFRDSKRILLMVLLMVVRGALKIVGER